MERSEERSAEVVEGNAIAQEAPLDPRAALAAEIRSRSEIYRMLHKLYYWPFSEEELDAIDVEGLAVLAETAESPLMAAGFNDMYRHLRRRNTGTREDLNTDFTRTFMGGATYKGLSCMPYASLFIGTEGRLMDEPRNRARAAYKRQRIKLAEGVDLPEDHLSFECEFMAIMGDRAAEAVEAGRDGEAVEALREQRTFLEQQMLPWTGRFFDLSAELVRSRFYRGVVKMTRGFLDEETATLAGLEEAARDLKAA